ncbi:hypothetical protein [Pinirhizobacter soli]|uniref:hypothetical protein n=1 Tax=Pinirhizobacter soli TaxID=2786953 RepID=UPI00202A2503|nr:hypothetical protein [Pinirhizobacter soli]
MHTLFPGCQNTWWFAACVMAVTLMLAALLLWRRRQRQEQARARAEQAVRDSAASAMEESMLQSGQGLILRFEAIARRLPPDHPTRRDLLAAIDRAERVLEKGLDRAQHRRDGGGRDDEQRP